MNVCPVSLFEITCLPGQRLPDHYLELHNGVYEDYQRLPSVMETEGFERTITGDNGTIYYLPTAEYYRVTNLPLNQVLESAKRAAGTTRKNYAAITTQSNGIMWFGLQQAM